MQSMTSIERVINVLDCKPVDQSPANLSPWPNTVKRWQNEGHLREGEDLGDHFDLDFRGGGWPNLVADLDFVPQTIEETEDTVLTLDGNGARLRTHKKHEATPEHVGFTVTDRAGWEERIRPRLIKADHRRIDFEAYGKERRVSAEKQRFFSWHGLGPFEAMHLAIGHENLLMNVLIDPEWMKAMAMSYAQLLVHLMEDLFAEQGGPDGVFIYEDLGFKQRPFMSPDHYREILMPAHKLLFDFAHGLGKKVIVHSCGFVEPLVPLMHEAGMNCLQAMEVKAGMDMPRLAQRFPDRLCFFGNIDARILEANDGARLDAEMLAKIPPTIEAGCGYILHSDHSESPMVNYETALTFLARGREITRQAWAKRERVFTL